MKNKKMWAGRFSKEIDEKVNDFNSSISFDARMYKEDIEGSIAHATMLGECDIIDLKESKAIVEGLKEILKDIESGKLQFDSASEDIHMFIESELTERLGDTGKRLHTASLVHDDVVDESGERRGQASVNATYNNKVAVLVGDYILSTALLHVSYSHSEEIVRYLAELGRVLSNGEILQLNTINNQEISEDVYYQVIKQKTAALFEACAVVPTAS